MIGIDTTFLIQLEVQEAPAHDRAHELLRREVLDPATALALTPQVLAEFIHVVTDPRRFKQPLTMEQALNKAMFWWNAAEVRHVHSSAEATLLFLEWMRMHQLGRKRILDTQLAAALWQAGVRRIMTSNPADFQIFQSFELLVP
jgi:predicted nucleic acid-binding protein